MHKPNNLIITSWNWKDYIAFFVLIPSILILIFLLPQSIKSSLILYTKNPTLLSIFFSNFVHSDFNHIKSNLTIYFFITFLIFGIETNKRVFNRIMLVIFFILPIFSSLIEVYFLPMLNTIQGFSAIVSALAGYFLYSICNYVKKFYEVHEISSFFWLLLMINFTLLTFFNQKLDMFVLTFFITLVFLYGNRTNIRTIFEKIKLKNKDIKKFKLLDRIYRIELFFLSLLFMFSLPFLVPFDIKMGTSVINTPAHYIGYLFGLVTVFIVERLSNYRKMPENFKKIIETGNLASKKALDLVKISQLPQGFKNDITKESYEFVVDDEPEFYKKLHHKLGIVTTGTMRCGKDKIKFIFYTHYAEYLNKKIKNGEVNNNLLKKMLIGFCLHESIEYYVDFRFVTEGKKEIILPTGDKITRAKHNVDLSNEKKINKVVELFFPDRIKYFKKLFSFDDIIEYFWKKSESDILKQKFKSTVQKI